MKNWSPKIEEELSLLIKDWLKQHGRTQADLRQSLQADSSRMPALLDVLKEEYAKGGLPKIVSKLITVEESWCNQQPLERTEEGLERRDPFGQLDFLLEEIKKDCDT